MSILTLIAAGLVAVGLIWFLWRRRIRVPYTLDLESSHEHLHAYLDLEDLLPDEGDEVVVKDAPSRIPYGTREVRSGEAEVRRASWLRRKWTRLVGRLEFYELYDVGFE